MPRRLFSNKTGGELISVAVRRLLIAAAFMAVEGGLWGGAQPVARGLWAQELGLSVSRTQAQ